MILSSQQLPLIYSILFDIYNAEILDGMIECVVHPLILILIFINLCWSPRQFKSVTKIFKLLYRIAIIVCHCGQKEFVVESIVFFHECIKVCQVSMAYIEELAPRKI